MMNLFINALVFAAITLPAANHYVKAGETGRQDQKDNTMAMTGKYNGKSVMETEYTTFGGGCFWCMDAVFSRVRGVRSVTPGYAGGHLHNPSYEQVKTGNTGHAEVVHIEYDPGEVSFLQLLEVFFRVHDPTTLNRQGADVGPQYRSIILAGDDYQLQTAEQVKQRLDSEGVWENKIVTEIVRLERFYQAEEYHHDYFEKNPQQAYCQMVIRPKVEKFKKLFEELLDK